MPKSRALEHATRRAIYEYLLVMPGAHFRAICRFLAVPLGTVVYHLNVLQTEGLVRSKVDGRRRRFFAIGVGSRADLNELFEQHWEFRDIRVRILAAVKRLGVTNPSKVARSLRISRQLAAYHINRLRKSGLVEG